MKRSLGVRRLLRACGFDVARYPVRSTLPGHLKWLFDVQKIDTVLDVGANRGQFATGLRQQAGFHGRIVSFEPTPDALAELEQKAANDLTWSAMACALGARDESAPLAIFDASDWNSLRDLDHVRLAASGRVIERIGTLTCTVKRLDGIWDAVVPAGATVFLKSDTQGNDLDVLEGAGDRLDMVAGLLLEASIHTFYEGEPDVAEVLSFAARVGFTPSGFFPVARSRESLALDTIDVCFVRGGQWGSRS